MARAYSLIHLFMPQTVIGNAYCVSQALEHRDELSSLRRSWSNGGRGQVDRPLQDRKRTAMAEVKALTGSPEERFNEAWRWVREEQGGVSQVGRMQLSQSG